MSIFLDNAQNAGNFNDRVNLVLLKYKETKRKGEKSKLDKLKKLYPDNEIFETGIIEFLEQRKFIYKVNGDLMQDTYGNWVYINDLPKYWQTTDSGELALQNRLFPSESGKQTSEYRFRIFQIIGICIAAIGGFITLITFFYKLLKSSF